MVPALALMARNPVGIPHVERLLLVWLLAWCVAVAWALILRKLTFDWQQATFSSYALVVAFFWGAYVVASLPGALGWIALVGLLSALTALVGKLERSTLLTPLVVAVSVGLLSGPVIDLYKSVVDYGESAVVDETVLRVNLTETPDLWLVVLDGHPGLVASEMDFGSAMTDRLRAAMSSAGLIASERVWSSYDLTDYSLPSIVNLGYPLEAPSQANATKRALYRIISGHNRLVSVLNVNGYETLMVESGWSGSSCASAFDVCIPSSWLDEPMYFMLERSVLRQALLDRRGYAFTVGARRSMQWALENADTLADDGVPSFVFLHILAPHPPFFLDSDCGTLVSDERSGVTFNRQGVSENERQSYLEGQIDCLWGFVKALSDQLGDAGELVVVSDHGTDRRDQLVTPPDAWSDDAVIERMNVVAAISLDGCNVAAPTVTPNFMRDLVNCLSEQEIPALPSRVFIGEDRELDWERLAALAG